MDKITRKTSFGQWFSPMNLQLLEEKVKTMKLDHYTKKLTTHSFLKLLLFAATAPNRKSSRSERLSF